MDDNTKAVHQMWSVVAGGALLLIGVVGFFCLLALCSEPQVSKDSTPVPATVEVDR